ncbi:MAG TPA: protein kinase [Kofleriaceae bacterium]
MGKTDEGNATTVAGFAWRARLSHVTPISLPVGRFEDDGPIGDGGRSTVHRIFDKTLLRYSAMKRLAPELKPYPAERQRFIEEAQIAAQLDHPNVVPVHELSLTDDGDLYFTMKLVEGRNLADLLDRLDNHPRSFDLVAPFLDILVKVCDAIAFAHSRGIIHRDIKPGNIMVGNFGEVYVMDWGVARLVDGKSDVTTARGAHAQSLDPHGHPIGTPAYMAPEQAAGLHDETDERSDVFALGATLYHILTGQAPYDNVAIDLAGMIAAARRCEIRPAEKLSGAARLPRGLSRIAMKAMARDPAHRYPSAAAFKDDLLVQLRGSADLPRCIFSAGDTIVAEGEPGDAAYIIVSGTCRVFKTVNHEDVDLRILGPGEVFGETAIFSRAPRSASVQALETLVLQVVSPEVLEEAVGLHGGLGLFIRTLAERFREVDERLSQLDAELRVRR